MFQGCVAKFLDQWVQLVFSISFCGDVDDTVMLMHVYVIQYGLI